MIKRNLPVKISLHASFFCVFVYIFAEKSMYIFFVAFKDKLLIEKAIYHISLLKDGKTYEQIKHR